MTLVEMIIAVVLIGGGLFLLVGWTRMVRDEAKTLLAADLLVRLDQALAQYFSAERAYPPTFDDDPDPVVAALLRDARARPLLDALPESLWSAGPPRKLVDPWGNSLHYLGDPRRTDVLANGGRPIFVSAGRDRTYRESSVSGLADDLRSDDPVADQFRDAASQPAD